MKKIFLAAIGAILMNQNIRAAEPMLGNLEELKFSPPAVERIETPNKLAIYAQEDKTLPIIHLTAMIKTGKVYDPKEKIGLGELTLALLRDGGTKKYKAEDLDKRLEFLAASIDYSISNEEARFSMTCLKKDFNEVFDIFFEMLNSPAFEEKIFTLKRDEMLEIIKRRNDKTDRQASREALRYFFGKDHPYGWRSELSTINSISIEDLKAFHSNYFKANNIIIAAAGDFEKAELIKTLKEKFALMPGAEVIYPKIAEVNLPQNRQVYLINKPVSQSSVAILLEGVKRHDDKEFPLAVLSEYMGGGIQSKLGQEIRSKRGLAYSVYSYFSKRNKSGFIFSYMGTKAQSVNEGLNEILKQLELAAKGEIEDKEFEMAKSQLINSFVFRFPTTFNIVEERASYEMYGYKTDYLDNYVANLKKVSKQDVINTAKEFYKTQKAMILVAGDAAKFDKPLNNMGDVTELKED